MLELFKTIELFFIPVPLCSRVRLSPIPLKLYSFVKEEHPELKCYSTLIKSNSKIWWSGRQPCY